VSAFCTENAPYCISLVVYKVNKDVYKSLVIYKVNKDVYKVNKDIYGKAELVIIFFETNRQERTCYNFWIIEEKLASVSRRSSRIMKENNSLVLSKFYSVNQVCSPCTRAME